MLVVTRKVGEAVLINDEIRVEVVEIRPGRVKLGVDAPNWMSIHREELLEDEDRPCPLPACDTGDD